jgi:nucleotide-binding universal stress UspA family protein
MTESLSSASGPRHVATVVVPTDFSAESLKALRYGAAVARKFQAQLHILHVSEIDYAIPGPALPGADPFTSDTEEARQLKQQLSLDVGDSITPTFHGRTGRAFDQICRCARELKADLIVMATHGRTGLKRFVLGSNAERVVQHSSSPVLIVREHERELLADGGQLRLQTMLVATDFSDSSGEALSYALTLARQFNTRLIIFHSFAIPNFTATDLGAQPAAPKPEELQAAAEDQMRTFVEGIDFGGVEFETQVRPGSAAEGICDQGEKQKADLIVISTHGRTGLLHVLIGSVAEHVVRYARSPVLVIPKRPELQPEAP